MNTCLLALRFVHQHKLIRNYFQKTFRKARQTWTKEEEQKLLKSHQAHGQDWTRTAQEFPHRAPQALLRKYAQLQNQTLYRPEPATVQLLETLKASPVSWSQWRKEHNIETQVSVLKEYYARHGPQSVIQTGRWSPKEFRSLQKAVEARQGLPINWLQVSFKVKTRTESQCRNKWHHAKNPKLGRFSPEEDQALLAAIEQYGDHDLNLVQKAMRTQRSVTLLKDRYQNYLLPSLDRSRWTAEEKKKCLELFDSLGSVEKVYQFYNSKRSKRNLYNLFRAYNKKRSPSDGE